MPFSSKSLIRKIYRAKKIAKNTHNVGKSFRDEKTLEVFLLASYLFFCNRLRLVTLLGNPGYFSI